MECNFTNPVLDEDDCSIGRTPCLNEATYSVEYLEDAKLYTQAEIVYCCDDHKATAEYDTKKKLGDIKSLSEAIECTDVQLLSPEETVLSGELRNMKDPEFITWMAEKYTSTSKSTSEFYVGLREMERRWKQTGEFHQRLLAIGIKPSTYRMQKMRQLEITRQLELTDGNTTTGVTSCDTTPAKDTKKSDAGKKGGAPKAAKTAKKDGKKPTTSGIKPIKPLPPPTPTTTTEIEIPETVEIEIPKTVTPSGLPFGTSKLVSNVDGSLEQTTGGFIDYKYDVVIDWNLVRGMADRAVVSKGNKSTFGAITITVTSKKLAEPEPETSPEPAKKKPVQNQVVIPFTQVGKTQEEIDAHFDAEMEAAHPYFTEGEEAV